MRSGRSFRAINCRQGGRWVALLLTGLLLLAVCSAPASAQKPKGSSAKAQQAKLKEQKQEIQRAKKFFQKAAQAIARAAYDDAAYQLQLAAAAAPHWPVAWKNLAEIYVKLKNYQSACQAYKHLMELSPGNLSVTREYARCLVQASDYDEAEKLWQELLDHDGNDTEALYNMALILYSRGRDYYPQAKSYLEEACLLKPDYYQAMALQCKVAAQSGDYFTASKVLETLRLNLPPGHPYLLDAQTQEEKITTGLRTIWGSIGGGVLLIIFLAIFIAKANRDRDKVKIKPPPAEMDALSEDSVCRYVLAHIMNITQLPRGLCWLVPTDGRHIELVISELIRDPTPFSLRKLNNKTVKDFVDAYGKGPFLFKGVSKEQLFRDTFPGLVNDLQDIEINVGVPLVWRENLLGLILVGRSRATSAEAARKYYEAGIEKIQAVCEQGAVALDRLFQRKAKDVDARTGLWSRDYFERQVAAMSRGCYMLGRPLCAYMVTLAGIKKYLEIHSEDFGTETLYNMGIALQESISKEPNITLCHLDNGVFGVIAPERDADEGIRLARTLQTFISQVPMPDSQDMGNGLVAWTVFPDDSKDPKMLRAILTRAFHDVRSGHEDNIVRAQNVSDATKASSQGPVVEDPKESVENMVITRRVTVTGGAGMTRPTGAATGALAAAREEGEPLKINLGSKGGPSRATRPLQASGGVAASLESKKEERIPSPNRPAALSLGKSEPSDPSAPFTLEPDLDEDGVDRDTQFCGEEAFLDVINAELEMADESGEDCVIVYVRFQNLAELRSQGRASYIKVRKEIAALISAFLREDSDIPGLVGEDDLAIFMIGSQLETAKVFADRVNNTSANLGGVKLSIGIALRQSQGLDGPALIAAGAQLAKGPGVHLPS